MAPSERRHLERFRLRVPLRFRPTGLASDTTEHFTEAINLSRGGFFFVTSAPLQVGMPIEATLRMPIEVTGYTTGRDSLQGSSGACEGGCLQRWPRRIGAEIESFIEPSKPRPPSPNW